MSRHPHSCVLLAVDSASTSGWSLWSCGVRINSGEVDPSDHEAVAGVCQAAVKYSYEELPKVLVLERPFGGTLRTVDGLGMRRGMWLASWARACQDRRPRRYVSVYPQTWRKVFGLKSKVMAEYQQPTLRAHGVDLHRQPGSDEFEALMIGLWAMRSDKVAAVIPKKYRAAI